MTNDDRRSTTFAVQPGDGYIVLTTYRKNGHAVPTTVWFAAEGERLYVTTNVQSGKAKRIRNNPAVTVAPSDQVGNVHGPTVPGSARVLAIDEQAVAIHALRNKYGATYDEVTGRMAEGQPEGTRIFICVEPA